MQAEAGQALDAIIARKELERSAGEGLFFWGVGNAPAVATKVLATAKHPVDVVFSVMKTRPKAVDVDPPRILLWRKYVDANMRERPLPSHVLVTSRDSSEPGRKKHHFALMCYSTRPLRLKKGIPFDPSAFRNVGGTQAPVGASQVTALLRKTGEFSDSPDYEANLTASLVESYWVRLTDPILVSKEHISKLSHLAMHQPNNWLEALHQLRTQSSADGVAQSQHELL
jgi:hypothetical protein